MIFECRVLDLDDGRGPLGEGERIGALDFHVVEDEFLAWRSLGLFRRNIDAGSRLGEATREVRLAKKESQKADTEKSPARHGGTIVHRVSRANGIGRRWMAWHMRLDK